MDRSELARNHAEDLGFYPRDCVRWLAPAELTRTAVKVGLAGAFAAYADKREVQQAFESRTEQLCDRDELWFDFVADLGDGFDATYTVAHAVAQPELEVVDPSGRGTVTLPAGDLLVFGGDEVYPASSAQGYEDRTTGPYRAALPAGPGRAALGERIILALPGNHDWYDGLTSFLRTFTQSRVFGGWRTVQARSYFVAQLPHRWWLVGLDTQLAANVDEPQLRFLMKNVSSRLKEGDGIIVCTAAPSWMHTRSKHDADAFNTLHFLERNYLRRNPDLETRTSEPTGAAVRLWLTGDSHHYVRYTEVPPTAGPPAAPEEADPDAAGARPDPDAAAGAPSDPRATQFITCGLGGAYLGGTHAVPEELVLPPEGSRMRDRDEQGRRFRLASETYPSRSESRRMAWRLALPGRYHLLARNPSFGLFMGGVHVALFILFNQLFGVVQGRPAVTARRSGEIGAACWTALAVVVVVVLVAVGTALWRSWQRMRTWPPDPAGRPLWVAMWWIGFSTALLWGLQIALAAGVFVLAVVDPWNTGFPLVDLLVTVVVAAVVGAVLGAEGFALYVRSADGTEAADWQMSGQAVEDRKGFLRIRVSPTGVEVYPLVIDEVCRDWAVERVDDATVRPVPAGAPPVVRQFEPVIRISRQGYDT